MAVAGPVINLKALERLEGPEKEAVLEQLRAYEQGLKANPLWAYNSPFSARKHPKQLAFHARPAARTRLYIGGNRSGKTTGTFVDKLIQALPWEFVPDHLKPFKRWDPPYYGRIVGPNLTRWLEGIALQKMREWCPKDALVGGSFGRGFEKQQVILRFKCGSWIQFMSNDQDLDAFAGAALHGVTYDEPPREDIYYENRYRLIDYGGEEMFGLTPTEGMSNWLHDKFYEPWEKFEGELPADELERLLGFRLILVDMDDNPHLSEEDKEWALEGTPEQEREARKTGRFISFEGLIYPQFSAETHVIPDEDEIPDGVECFEGIDSGIRHMAAVVFCYLTADDRLVVYDELALQGKTIAAVCDEIRKKRELWRVEPRFTVIDPAVRNRNPQTGRSDQQEFHDNGIFTIPGQNEVRAGINRVRERLEAQGRLQVAASCTELRREFKKYRWAKDSKRTENAPPDRPVKKDDHLLDALRYVVMQRPLRPGRDVPREGETRLELMLRQHLRRRRGLSRAVDPGNGFGPGLYA